jgi:hypothetical protein
MKLLEKLAQPARFNHSISNNTILSFSTGAVERETTRWTLQGPRDEIGPKKHHVAGGRPTSVWAPDPVDIGVDDQLMGGVPKVEVRSTVPKGTKRICLTAPKCGSQESCI